MDMETLKVYISGFILLTMVGAIGAIVLTALADDQVDGTTNCNATSGDYTGCNEAWNITNDGNQGIGNTTAQFPTAGTILGVALLLGIVFSAFYMLQKRQ